MHLDSDRFRQVVTSAPLVSIDLLVCDSDGRVLLGQRLNRPAIGYWFVPGGRIYKNETLDAAFERITLVELGRTFRRSQARLLGIYEHFYEDSVFGTQGEAPDTHYVVAGYRLDLPAGASLTPPRQQHDAYLWWEAEAMLASPEVHDNSKAYLHTPL
ncbi:GDP-mannose mannosyl hydrolase [Pseudomonas sp.]|jgi:colanic acid biosynthesis protein WcaH|uniref:GDP-mannose mannosyl hydrolase n=1 Tax=Pseudomonas sp. TaxID=306 RepID=UPI00272D0FC6|nr:GDP-mannose mannosyl hydrolase [Pseudomonas sp.]